jgi:hypothetical protein
LLGDKRPQLPPTEFEIDIDRAGDGYELELEVDGREREVELASCQEAQDAAVLLIATAIDPDAILRVEKPPPPPPEPAKPPRQKPPPYRWSLLLGGLFDLQSLPGPIAAPNLGALWQGACWRSWLALRYLPARKARGVDVDAQVDLFASALGGAHVWELGPIKLGPAAELELGALRARDVRGRVSAQNDAGPWGSALFGALAAYGATKRIGVELGLYVGVPLWRPELSVRNASSFYTTAPVTMRLALTARVSLGSP